MATIAINLKAVLPIADPVSGIALIGLLILLGFGLSAEEEGDADAQASRKMSADAAVNAGPTRMFDNPPALDFATPVPRAIVSDAPRLNDTVAGGKNGGVGNASIPMATSSLVFAAHHAQALYPGRITQMPPACRGNAQRVAPIALALQNPTPATQ